MKLWTWFRRKRKFEQEMGEELRDHVERQTAANVAAGMTPEEARRQARLQIGAVEGVKAECREQRCGFWLESLWSDIRYGLRVLRKSPGFTAVAVLTLALGIGANTAIFSMVDALILRPLPIHNPRQLTFLTFPRDATHFEAIFSATELREIREQTSGVFSDVNGIVLGGLSGPTSRSDGLTVKGITRPVQTAFVSGEFFQMLGIQPYLGRFILASEGNAAGGDAVVVLSYRYWERRFHGDPSVVNRSAFVNGHPVTIVGIGPKGFHGPTPLIEMEAYLPLGMKTVETGGNGSFLTDPRARDMLILARLLPGMSLARANAALSPVGEHLAKEYPRPGIGTTLQARSLRPPGLMNGPNPLPKLAALFLILAGVVLVLACLNLVNLLLVRAATRQREFAVRAALGGGRIRLLRHLLSETMLLACAGAGAGMLVATVALQALSSTAVTASDLPIVFEFPFDARVFAYAMCIAVLSAVLVGILPALRVSRGNLGTILHDGGRGATGRSQRTRGALVSVQVSGSLALLIVAGLFARSLRNAQNADPGFDPRNVLNVKLDPGEIGYTQSQAIEFYDQLLARVRALAGVQSASLSAGVPLSSYGFREDSIAVPGYVPRTGEHLSANYDAISPGYFTTMGIAIVDGRDFGASDGGSSPHVAVINQAMADRFWPHMDPIGRSFHREGDSQHAIEIVGVARNSKIEDVWEPYTPVFYLPLSQSYASDQTLQIRTAGPPQAIAPAILSIVRGLASAAPILSIRTMTDAIAGGDLQLFDIGAELTGALGLLGLTLAVVGMYGVMAYAVGQRTQEIGVRIALGAQKSSILWMISRQGLAIVTIGLGIGFAIALAVGKLLAEFLVGVSSTDPLTYVVVSTVLAVVALAACWIPARRAMKVDPMTALRYE